MARILYLDDDQGLVFLVSRVLTELGHRASTFTDAHSALAAFKAAPHEFDFVLTDMSMPGASGLEFAREVLQIEPRVPVVIATGCEEPNWVAEARAAGVREVIGKPATMEAMKSAIGRLLAGLG